MRRFFGLMLALLMIALPSWVFAKGEVTLQTLQVQLWPEYDQPAMLVIYDFSLPADANFPVDVDVRIPAGAQLLAVARQEVGGLLTIGYNGPTRDGKWDVVSIAVEKDVIYRVEYYAPLVKNGLSRSYEYVWAGDYAVNSFELLLQEPLGSQMVKTVPPANAIALGVDGLRYQSLTLQDVPAGEDMRWSISYQKDSDALSISALGVEPAAPLAESVDSGNVFLENLPLALGILGIVLILGSAIWYWLAGRSSSSDEKAPLRKRGSSSIQHVSDVDGECYCSQCGKRAQAADRFCRACGTRLRHGE